MFTGIVSGLGRILTVDPLGDDSPRPSPAAYDGGAHGVRLTVATPAGYLDDAQAGDSIAIDGACMTLTVFDAAAARFTVDVSAESLSKTAALDRPGPVNLEKALRAGDRLGGHLVSGHVDGIGTVTRFEPAGESMRLVVRAPSSLRRFLAVKGSITVNGVSLTVNLAEDGGDGCEFSINLVPHTLGHTTLGSLVVGQRVNLEVDLIARYVERLMSAG